MSSLEGMYESLLESAPDAIIGVDGTGHIRLVNRQTERLFGYPRSELLGMLVEALVPDSARHVHARHRERYLSDPRPRPMGAGMELTGRRKDGSEFPCEISLSAIETSDGNFVSAAVRDVTDRIEAQAERERLRAEAQRERLEGQIRQSQRLESLGQLAGGVAHDFNNLLGAILNYAAFVQEEIEVLPSELTGETSLLNDIEQIRRAAERGAQLTHQLLSFGRREVVQPRVVNLNQVVDGVEQMLQRTIGEHVALHTQLELGLSPIFADAGQLEQVLVNLAINARDAMPAGGNLTIETTNVVVDDAYAEAFAGLTPGEYVRLRVSDDGVGMSREVKEHAFEPFFTTKAKGEGSGLGLATVYGIVTQAAGHVHLYSEPGLGTTFSVLFPITTEEEGSVATEAARLGESGGETVLVVEDEAAMREVTRRILYRHGYRVLVAGSGAEALEMLARGDGPIDLLVTDVIMPHMFGKELAERVRGHHPSTRVLFMSGYAQPILSSQGTLDPGVVLIEKPFTAEQLIRKVRQVIDETLTP